MLPMKNAKKSVQQKVKESNLSSIFNLIAKNEGISRVDIAKRLGLSTSTVSTLTDELLHKRIIIETGEVKSGDVGRRAIRLQINPLGGFFVCVVFSKGEFQIDIYDLKEKLESSHKISFSGEVLTGAYIIDKIEEKIEFGYKYGKFFGLLFIMPSRQATSDTAMHMKEHYGYYFDPDWFRMIKNFYKDTMVLSESSIILSSHGRYFNTSSDVSLKVFHVNVDDMVTSCLMTSDEKNDERKTLKDFGKVGIDFNSSVETGKGGQLKNYVTTNAIVSLINSSLNEELSFEQVVEGFKSGNGKIIEVVKKACYAFSYAISNVINVVDVKAVIVSGEITSFGDKFKDYVCDYLFKFDSNLKNVYVKFFDDERLVSRCGMYYMFDKVFSGTDFDIAIAKQ